MKRDLRESGRCVAKYEDDGRRECEHWKQDVTGLCHCDHYQMLFGLCLRGKGARDDQ